MKSNKVMVRLLDAALLAALVFGSADVKLFAYVVVAIMTTLISVGLLTMTPDLAEKICGRSLTKKIFGILVSVLYVIALIYAGFPILAAVYAVIVSMIRFSAEAKLKSQVKS